MKVIILAGGLGTRISEYTKLIPKPMIKIANKPLLIHIIELYLKFKYEDFYIALGYKSNVVTKYFKNFKKFNKKFKFKVKNKTCTITLVYTGKSTLTGGRIKRLEKFINKDENFMFTYGDGISNVNLKKLFKLHEQKKKLVTVTAVNPQSRFGELKIRNKKVVDFSEKHKMLESWINGGFFVINKKFIKLIKNNSTILEREPLEKAARSGELVAYKHFGFWQCMDTKRDKDNLNRIFKKNKKFI